MLLATYQPLYSKEELAMNRDKRSMGRYKGIDFDPVWCIPFKNLSDAYIASKFAAPRFPDIFYILDTEDYVRIDKVLWYQEVKRRREVDDDDAIDLSGMICSDDIPDVGCEFLVSRDDLEKKVVAAVFSYALWESIKDGSETPPVMFMREVEYPDDDYWDAAWEIYDRLCSRHFSIEEKSLPGFSDEPREYQEYKTQTLYRRSCAHGLSPVGVEFSLFTDAYRRR